MINQLSCIDGVIGAGWFTHIAVDAFIGNHQGHGFIIITKALRLTQTKTKCQILVLALGAENSGSLSNLHG